MLARITSARFLILLLIIGLIFSGCTKKGKESTQTAEPVTPEPIETFRVAYNTWVGFGPLFIAKEKGYFKSEGLQVELKLMEGTGEKGSALAGGKIDAIATTADSFIIQAAQGVKGKIVLAFDESLGADGVVASKSISSVADLKGKRVALQPGFVGHFFLLALMRDQGLNPNDISIVPMETGEAGAAFVAGKVDAAVTWEPWLSKAKERADGKVLITSKDKPGLIADVLVVSNSYLSAKPAAVSKFARAWYRAVAFWKNNREQADQIVAKAFNLPIGEAQEMLSGLRFFDEAGNRTYFGTKSQKGMIYKVIENASELWLKAGIIKNPVNPAELVDSSVVTH